MPHTSLPHAHNLLGPTLRQNGFKDENKSAKCLSIETLLFNVSCIMKALITTLKNCICDEKSRSYIFLIEGTIGHKIRFLKLDSKTCITIRIIYWLIPEKTMKVHLITSKHLLLKRNLVIAITVVPNTRFKRRCKMIT